MLGSRETSAKLVSLAIAAAACLPIAAHTEPPNTTGTITGRILTARCAHPLRYANVIVIGTTHGAMTDEFGRFCIPDVPVGDQRVRAMMMAYRSSESAVSVAAGDTVRADFTLRPIWFGRMAPKPSGLTSICTEHAVRMRWVLAPTILGSPVVVDPDDERRFPNAWPHIDAERGLGAIKTVWGQSCPECVAGMNEKYSGQRWRPSRRTPATWGHYQVPGVVEFRAPRGLADSVAVDSCTVAGAWKGKDLRIEIRRGPAGFLNACGSIVYGLLPPVKRGYHVWDVIGDCKAAISVGSTAGTTWVSASFASTTCSFDDLQIVIKVSGNHAQQTARTILATLRFPGPAIE